MELNRKNLSVTIFVFLLIAIICIAFYALIFSNYQGSSSTRTGIFTGSYPDHDDKLRVEYFTLDINPQKHRATLGFIVTAFEEGNYSIALSLPFKVELDSSENLGTGMWYLRNGILGSVVMVTFEIKNSSVNWDSPQLCIRLQTKDTIDNRSFDTHSISLAFGSSYSQDLHEIIEELREISPISGRNPYNGIVVVALPQTAFITTTTHQIERIDPATDTNYQAYEFRITDAKPFYLQYIDSEEKSNFEIFLLISGAIFGALFGFITSKLFDKFSPFFSSKLQLLRTKENVDQKKTENNSKDIKITNGDSILSIIRLIDNKKSEIFKATDSFKGGATSSIIAILVMLAIVEIILFFVDGGQFEKLSVALSFSALTVGYFSFILQFNERNILNLNYDRLEKHVEKKQKPLLKALLKIKSKHTTFDLEEIYNKNSSMFTAEKLLELLYT